ncbi:alpha/beta hydrolase [Solibacillus sp. R5-41]|uniref:alpha/beta fold hydrolase n=1 Tax=Solibacillus sp. R5-41 TaxID=2048654 RepID=UPI000C1269C4|nr:alpha/beta hydrolase [Solibacillus sp. R5-41]ATP40025.1 alpha/beta hydrolase [Solibacillus sp. R5-41]
MPIASINNTQIFYVDEGEGTPIVFIHGLGASHTMFEPQIETFSKTHRVICPDTRGNGKSGKLTGPVKSILDRQNDDIATLLKSLGIEKAVFCGVSYGGVFTYHFVLRYPELVEAMVIVDSFGDTKIVGPKEFFLMASQYATIWAYYLPSSWMVSPIKAQYKKWPLAQKHLVNIVRNMRKHEVMLQRLAINNANHTDYLMGVNCPTLGIVGNGTKVGVKYMERSIGVVPDSELKIVENSFDPTNLCQREKFDELLYDFLVQIGW